MTVAAEAFLAGLGETSFTLGDHVVIDIAVTARDGQRVTIEALTMEGK